LEVVEELLGVALARLAVAVAVAEVLGVRLVGVDPPDKHSSELQALVLEVGVLAQVAFLEVSFLE
jgi:hypothetical protein